MDIKIELVVFDMAGTTVQDNHEVEACFAQAAEKSGLTVSNERILELQGYSKIEVFQIIYRELFPFMSQNEMTLRIKDSYQIFCEILENHYLQFGASPTEGCLELFEYLKQNNIKIALTTGFYRKVTDIILDKLNWLNGLDENRIGNQNSIIDISIASDEVQNGRPKPDMILKATKLLQVVDLKKIVVIGDTPSDILAGDGSGAGYVVAITNGTHSVEQLRPFYPQFMVNSMLDFKVFLSKILAEN